MPYRISFFGGSVRGRGGVAVGKWDDKPLLLRGKKARVTAKSILAVFA